MECHLKDPAAFERRRGADAPGSFEQTDRSEWQADPAPRAFDVVADADDLQSRAGGGIRSHARAIRPEMHEDVVVELSDVCRRLDVG